MPENPRALWFTEAGKAEIRPVSLPMLSDELAQIRAKTGAISRGTERLVFEGKVPPSERDGMRAPFQQGDFTFPVCYGYQTVGVVEEGPAAWLGRDVFCLHPHQTHFQAPVGALVPVPESVSIERAVLAASMETALNAVWDSAVGPVDRIAIVGAGQIGFLIAYLVNEIPGTEVTLIDIDETLKPIAAKLGLNFLSADAPRAAFPSDCDCVFHASATEAGLECALSVAGNEATIVELSWYGDRRISVPLGGAFHSRRLKLVSSQVGQVSTGHRPRWDQHRRLTAAMNLLADDRLGILLSSPCAFDDLPEKLPYMLSQRGDGLVPTIRYS